ncbi:MAG: glycerophosphodiester phosphodiesterase [Elusimicrobia bacterium]|nr:glycerophosphodiester phosphodiesterase [Elusimicrobiota bacterium]
MLVIAHRGASGHAPENTRAAFRRALELGARAIELDVHQTLDGELVVAHDDDLRRRGRLRRKLKSLTWEQAAAVDVGSWFAPEFAAERLPRLDDVYDLLPPGVELHVEIKHGSSVYPGIEERVVALIRRRRVQARTLVSSFDHAALRALRALDAEARVGYLLGLTSLKTAFREMKPLSAESLNMSLRQTTRRAVAAAHQRGYKVLVYTVNSPADRDRLAALGVDGIFTNYPELDLWRS